LGRTTTGYNIDRMRRVAFRFPVVPGMQGVVSLDDTDDHAGRVGFVLGAFMVCLRGRIVGMSKWRRLRRLVPDEELYDRRVAGESLRAIAPDYGVVHTTLSDFFRRPEAVLGLEDARRRLEAERKARHAMLRSLEQDVRRRAREDQERDRQLEAWKLPGGSQPSDYVDWLNLHDAPRGLTSRQRYSTNDCTAAGIADSGGGVEQVIDATGLRSRENVLRGIDAQIMRRALANDTKFPSNARPDARRLRRLVPDSELIRRGAAKEPLRSIAADYGVSHTTILRYFKGPAVAKQLLRAKRRRDLPRGRRMPG
jgi:hypothetical protein